QDELLGDEVKQMIRQRIRREKKVLFEYFWASYAWQFIIYVATTNMIIHFWGDWKVVLVCLTGILMYVPFTTVFIKKFTRMAAKTNGSFQNLHSNLKLQWDKMNEFFVFKRRFDWLGIPVSCLILTLIIFKLWVPGGWEEHLMGALIVYLLAIAAFLLATVMENRKRFKDPLNKLSLIIKEIEEAQ
ncbi:MAG TPA: hypothetical protein VIT44_00815, partial [Cyclobacteriaceae bacterium]